MDTINHIIIIGNGFDLAHGLKTKYSDFIYWYLKKAVIKYNKDLVYDDDLISIKPNSNAVRYPIPEFSMSSTEQIINELERQEYLNHFKSEFFNSIVRKSIETNWVDIENEYYNTLQNLIDQKIRTDETTIFKKEVSNLNLAMATIQNELKFYLTSQIRDLEISPMTEILDHLRAIKSNASKANTLILNFNYTSTIGIYLQELVISNLTRLDIHGSINDKYNPIIFGYGDEMDKNYSRIEDIEDDEALAYMKSFSYFKTDQYNTLIDFINSGQYVVHLMGHSCGRSDRLLLNRIFENEYCHKIKVYYHHIDENHNDYISKTMAISRLFVNKSLMRDKVLNINKCKPLAYAHELELSTMQ